MGTKTEGYIKELKRLGFQEVETRSTKNRAFTHKDLKNLIFVGRRANIKYGKNVSTSIGIRQPDKLLNHLQQKFIEEVIK